jgi:hypothetical protein
MDIAKYKEEKAAISEKHKRHEQEEENRGEAIRRFAMEGMVNHTTTDSVLQEITNGSFSSTDSICSGPPPERSNEWRKRARVRRDCDPDGGGEILIANTDAETAIHHNAATISRADPVPQVQS